MKQQDIIEQINQEEIEQLHSIPAQRLIEKLSLIKNNVNQSKKRWFWELLQNASDYNKSVNIKLIVTEEKVTFKHDGAPFSTRDMLNIISPDSNKLDDKIHEDNIGKFGTGLISTHILSSKLNIEGLCIDEYKKSYTFNISLDRYCYKNKQELIKRTTETRKKWKDSLKPIEIDSGFNTSFSYNLGDPLPDVPPIKGSDIDLNYLYETLPYTLCFMPKVKSIIIEDHRKNGNIKEYKIHRKIVNENVIIFNVVMDKVQADRKFIYFSVEDISSVFEIENNNIIQYPKNISRFFCGLPLIGTEDIGLPILLNSHKFTPTTEREGIEIDPNANPTNNDLLKKSIELYGKILDYVTENKLRKAFNITKLSHKYNGKQESNEQFKSIFIPKYKKHILEHKIVVNANNEFIQFSNIKLPFKDSKCDTKLYNNSIFINKTFLPIESDYIDWFNATDFTIFTEQKYTSTLFAEEIEKKNNIYSFGHSQNEVLDWLYRCCEYFLECDRYIFSKKKLLPNQLGNLCYVEDLYADINLSDDLKEIYDSLVSNEENMIGNKLLERAYNEIKIINKEYTLEKLAKDIDNELKQQYTKNHGNASFISSPVNKLYDWIQKSDITPERLQLYFSWYYPKRATLIVDLLTDSQREKALIIAQSGKIESLAALASSDLTEEDIQLIIANIKKIPQALSLLSDKIDDKTFASTTNGEMGEEIVYKDLLRKFPSKKGYKVIWASRDKNEPCFDFEITLNNKTYCYCDAKTTSRGIANANSIPLFLRKSQWDFIQELNDEIPYLIARVFLQDGCETKYLRIQKK